MFSSIQSSILGPLANWLVTQLIDELHTAVTLKFLVMVLIIALLWVTVSRLSSSSTHSSGSKAAAVEFSNSMYDLGSPVSAGPLQVVQLAEDLKLALELQPNQEERDSLRSQLPSETAQALIDWLQAGAVSTLHATLQIISHLNMTFFRIICCLQFAFCCVVFTTHNCSQVKWRCRTWSVSHQAASCCVRVVIFEVFLMSTQKEFHFSVRSVIAAWRIVLCILRLWCFFCFFVVTHEEKAKDERPSRVRNLLGSLCKDRLFEHEELFPCSQEALCSVDFSHCAMCSPSVNHPLSWKSANAWMFSTRAHVFCAFKG